MPPLPTLHDHAVDDRGTQAVAVQSLLQTVAGELPEYSS